MTVRPVAIPKMPRRLNHTVGIDLRQEYDSENKAYVTMDVICYATNFSAYELLESKDPSSECLIAYQAERWVPSSKQRTRLETSKRSRTQSAVGLCRSGRQLCPPWFV